MNENLHAGAIKAAIRPGDELIEQTKLAVRAAEAGKKKSPLRFALPAAAAAAVILAVVFAVTRNAAVPKAPAQPTQITENPSVQTQPSAAPDASVTQPGTPEDLQKQNGVWLTPAPLPGSEGNGEGLSIVAFVVYNGKMYVADGLSYYNAADWERVPKEAKRISAMMSDDVLDYKDAWLSPVLLSDAQWNALIGEQLGVASGNVDCFNASQKEKEGYKELDGSLEGPVYALNGYSTADTLGFIATGDTIGFYDTYTVPNGYRRLLFLHALHGFSVETGADFFKAHLHTENTAAYKYVTDSDWQYGHTELSFNENDLTENAIRNIPLSDETMSDFMEALYASPAIAESLIITGNERQRHLFLRQQNGTYVILHLCENGRVICTGFYPDQTLCIAMDPDGIFKTVWNAAA